MPEASEAILWLTDGTVVIDLLGPGSGWKLSDPNWNPQIAQFKGGGSFVNSALAEGRQLVHKEYDNVVETIPLSVRGKDQNRALQTVRELMQLGRQAADYWAEPYEYDPVWMEVRPACNDCFAGYTRIFTARIAELTNPYGQPFYSDFNPDSIMEGITLIIEREPFWRATKPGEIIGPLYNLIKNPDFELWTQPPGIIDSQPDSWNDIHTLWITGTNNRQDVAVKYGQHALRINVSGSTLAGASKGISQIIADTIPGTEYTILAWVRSDGVSNGVGRILVTYASQLELYRANNRHGWTLYTGRFTTGGSADVVAINIQILTTAANTDGTIYIDGLMLIEGNWEQEAIDGILPWMSSSHIVNHWDQPEGAVVEVGDINWVDVWNIPGDVDALIRLEFVNNTEPSDWSDPIEIYKTIRVGQRRTLDVQDFRNYHDPVGVVDATASSDDKEITPSVDTNWKQTTSYIISGAPITRNNEGRFRVFARLYDDKASGETNLQARLRYFIGTPGIQDKILDVNNLNIVNEWTLINLTPNAALVRDFKLRPSPPNQMGYIIELRRSDGSDDAWLDYSLIMPTDGGYIEATLNPSLPYQLAFIVDNTIGTQVQIGSGERPVIWRKSFEAPNDFEVRSFKEFRGKVYAILRNSADVTRSRIYRQDEPTTWVEVFHPTDRLFILEVYNGVLYAGGIDDASGNAVLYQSNDGASWSLANTFVGISTVDALRSFDGLLWIGTGNPGRVYTYDGAAFALNWQIVPDAQSAFFEVYNNRLYLSTSVAAANARVHEYNPATNTWTESFNSGLQCGAMSVFNGYLWMGPLELASGTIYRYDGEIWESISDNALNAIDDYWVMHNYNNERLYMGGEVDIIGAPSLSSTANGETFRQETGIPHTEITLLPTWLIHAAYTDSNGALYIGFSSRFVANSAEIWVLSDQFISYEVSDFQGSTFTSPNRRLPNDPRRHRWIFSYDRDNFINNIDDKALIGIGFVPRYLSLRGRD